MKQFFVVGKNTFVVLTFYEILILDVEAYAFVHHCFTLCADAGVIFIMTRANRVPLQIQEAKTMR